MDKSVARRQTSRASIMYGSFRGSFSDVTIVNPARGLRVIFEGPEIRAFNFTHFAPSCVAMGWLVFLRSPGLSVIFDFTQPRGVSGSELEQHLGIFSWT